MVPPVSEPATEEPKKGPQIAENPKKGPEEHKKVQGKKCLTNLHGMGLPLDELRSMVKKWHTLMEGNTNVKTSASSKAQKDPNPA